MRCKQIIGWFSMKDKLWMDMLGHGVLRMDVLELDVLELDALRVDVLGGGCGERT